MAGVPGGQRVYPLPRPAHDERFTFGLIIDVADVLVAHGYPRPATGGDLVALQQALFGFLYADRVSRVRAMLATARVQVFDPKDPVQVAAAAGIATEEVPVEQVRAGDVVKTAGGWEQVTEPAVVNESGLVRVRTAPCGPNAARCYAPGSMVLVRRDRGADR